MLQRSLKIAFYVLAAAVCLCILCCSCRHASAVVATADTAHIATATVQHTVTNSSRTQVDSTVLLVLRDRILNPDSTVRYERILLDNRRTITLHDTLQHTDTLHQHDTVYRNIVKTVTQPGKKQDLTGWQKFIHCLGLIQLAAIIIMFILFAVKLIYGRK